MLGEKAYEEDLFKRLKDNLNLKEYEIGLLQDLSRELKRPVQSGSHAYNRLTELDAYRLKLINFIQAFDIQLTDLRNEYKKVYDPKFVQLTRAGRPNQQAVDSEIHNDEAMQKKRYILDNYENFRSMLFSYLKTIDSARETCIQLGRN